MATEKISFDDFLLTVNEENQAFVEQLHQKLSDYGCKVEIKSAKSGYVVSYIFNKKTVANYVFRKQGLLVRIYANSIVEYMPFLETLPIEMVNTIQGASVCKRLINPNDCNSKCAMGYDFTINGERYQKCRNSAFMFIVCEQTQPYIQAFLINEVKARS